MKQVLANFLSYNRFRTSTEKDSIVLTEEQGEGGSSAPKEAGFVMSY